jgi:hypothetical protein
MKDLLITIYGGGEEAVAAAQKLSTAGQWISVTERLPVVDGAYIVSTPVRNWFEGPKSFADVAYYGEGVFRDEDDWHILSVTHWMPLPEPPAA